MLERMSAWARTPAGKAVIALFVAGLVLRLVAVAVVDPDPRDGRFDDSVWYDSAARHLAAGDGYVFDPTVWYGSDGQRLFPGESQLSATALWPPGYPLALASVYRISGDSVMAGRLLNALCGAATILMIYAIARKLVGDTEAIFAAALMALFPASIYFTPLIMSETLFVFLLSSTLAFFLYLVLDREDPSPYAIVASGVLAGLTAMTHFEFIAFPAVMLALLALQLGIRRAAVPAGLLVVGFALVVSPWALRNHITLGETIVASTEVGRLAVQGHDARSDGIPNADILAAVDSRFSSLSRTDRELKVNSEGLYLARTFAWDHKLDELRLFPRRVFGLFRSDEAAITWAQSDKPVYGEETGKRLTTLCAFIFYATIALALVASPFWFRWRDPGRWLLFAPVPYVTFVFGVLLAGDPGYHVGMYPSLIVLASPALAALWRITHDNLRATFDAGAPSVRPRSRLQTRP
jgi:4-amino-4-deoxy-L-arabinose transferase-like glycosyltransferase